jgi:hypothetical protein
VREAAEKPDEESAAQALRQQIWQALRENAGLVEELAPLLPTPREVAQVTAAGERSVTAQSIGAVSLQEDTLRQHERFLGDGHLETLASSSDLALAYEAAGDLEKAIPCTRPRSPSGSRQPGEPCRPPRAGSGRSLSQSSAAGPDARRGPLRSLRSADAVPPTPHLACVEGEEVVTVNNPEGLVTV